MNCITTLPLLPRLLSETIIGSMYSGVIVSLKQATEGRNAARGRVCQIPAMPTLWSCQVGSIQPIRVSGRRMNKNNQKRIGNSCWWRVPQSRCSNKPGYHIVGNGDVQPNNDDSIRRLKEPGHETRARISAML